MCDQREHLIEYAYDECSADERRLVEEHLTSCDSCRDELGGLRRVRHDLLAWDVPDPGSVWKPFAPQPRASMWREVPAWALAAAASVMFLVGAAGGVATHAFMKKETPPPVVANAAPVQLNAQQLAALEARLRDVARVEVDSRMLLVSSHDTRSNASAAELDRLEAIINASRQTNADYMTNVNTAYDKLRVSTDMRIRLLEADLAALTAAVADLKSAGGR